MLLHFKKSYLQRQKEENHLKENQIIIKLRYGNEHSLVKFPTTSKKFNEKRKHRWNVYVRPFKTNYDINLLIKKVTFELHPSFSMTEVIRKSSPFEYGCKGWGYFDIPIEIHFRKWVGMPPLTITHALSFEGDGLHKIHRLVLDKQIFPKHFFNGKRKSFKSGK